MTETSKWAALFHQLVAQQNDELIEDLVWYLLQRGSKQVVDALEQENPMFEPIGDTILDRKFREGEATGELKVARRMVRSVLEGHHQFQVTPEVETRLQGASVDDLEHWLNRLCGGEPPAVVLGV